MTRTTALIKQFEGFSAEPYWDEHQWSIGYGSFAGSRDQNVRPNIRVTENQADLMLQRQLGPFERSVDRYDNIYDWSADERASLTSFAYNIGSIDQLTANGTRSRGEIAEAMLLYNKAGGGTNRGLARRRAIEQSLFTGGRNLPVDNEPAPERRQLSPEEEVRLRELQRARRNLDATLADPLASPIEKSQAQERFDAAKANSPLTGDNDRDARMLDAFGGAGEDYAAQQTGNGVDAGVSTGTNFNTQESLSGIVSEMERTGEWWENSLDEYQNYTYHLELFIVKEKDARDFLINESLNLDTIISNGWPGSDIQYITIAETGVTTEFNIQDLEIQSLGAGSSSLSKLAGTATRLSFTIMQVGNTSLNDNLMNAALLSGFPSIGLSKFFLKVNFKGYSDDGSTIRSENQNLTKVFPFVISNVGDVPSGTDERGTITTIQGTISPDYAVSTSCNMVQNNFEFNIKDTLKETIDEFITKLNTNIRKNDYTSDNIQENAFVNEYAVEFDPEFMTKYAESKMMGEDANMGSGSNEVSTRSGAVNIGTPIGTVAPGLSILDIIYDVCIQSLDIRKELTEARETFSDTISIIPNAIPRDGGLNILTGEQGHNVSYYITTKRRLIMQNNHDNANKVRNSGKLIKEIFEKQQCKKVYYYQFTGLNDQILDLNLSFNRQLVKAYSMPNETAYAQMFIEGNEQVMQDLNPRARAKIDELRLEHLAVQRDRTAANESRDELRAQIENTSEAITDKLVESSITSLMEQGVPQNIAEETASELRDKGLQAQLEAAAQYDPEILSVVSEERDEYTRLVGEISGLDDVANRLTAAGRRARNEIDEVTMQALGANFSRDANSQVRNISENFFGAPVTGSQGNDGGIGQRPATMPSGSTNPNQIILEELDDNLISTLTTQQLEDIVESLIMNPVIFKSNVLPYLTHNSHIKLFASSDEADINLAKQKFYEAVNMDISMETLKLTIKGDPYWIDTYLTAKTAKELYGTNGALDDYKNHPTNVNGSNYVTIVTNKAAGVDDNDNTKIAHLATMLYVVLDITSSFSQGQFVQQLDMIRIPVPDSFKPITPLFDAIESDSGYGSDRFGEFGGIESVVTDVLDDLVVAPFDGFVGAEEFTGLKFNLPDDITPVALAAEDAYAKISGGLMTLATAISEASLPTAAQASRFTVLMNEAQAAANAGSPSAALAIESVKAKLRDNFGTADEASEIFQELIDDGEPVSPELIAMLNTHIYEDENLTVTGGSFNPADVNEITTEIENLNAVNLYSAGDLAMDIPTAMTSTVDTNPISTTPPSALVLANSNMMLDGTLPLLSTEAYKDPTPPQVDYDVAKLAELRLPEEIDSGFKDVSATRNGIKIRNYIDSLPLAEQQKLNSLDSPYIVKTQPVIESVPTITKIINTPLKTPREAIMQARIADAQMQMVAEAGGSYNKLSVDEKRHYENLSDAYDEIDEIATLDPIRNEAKLGIVQEELDKSIRIYNDRLSGGDSEWSWTKAEALEAEALEATNTATVLQNISNVDNRPSSPTASLVKVNTDGSVSLISDISALPSVPTDGFTLPTNYKVADDTIEITDAHRVQYESAQATWDDFKKGEYVEVTVIDSTGGEPFKWNLISVYENEAIAQSLGIDTTPGVAGETITDEDPRYNQWNMANMGRIRNDIVDNYPLITTGKKLEAERDAAGILTIDISLDEFVIDNRDEE